jgi:hypothetical protein
VYSDVMVMETVWLGFLLAKMNGLKVCPADISSSFFTARLANADISSPDLDSVHSRGRNW